MTTIVTRAGKGSALTHNELDTNFTNLNTDKVEASGDSMTGDLSFGDNVKAKFGAGDDLQIYHTGSASFVKDAGTGNLNICGTDINFLTGDESEYLATFATNGGCLLRYDNALKLATTSTGVNVTGTLTADGLTVDGVSGNMASFNGTLGNVTINADGAALSFTRPSASYIRASDASGSLYLDTGGSTRSVTISANKDVSFYEDTGTTAKFFWDASAERLGIGTTSPVYDLDVAGDVVIDNASYYFSRTTTGATRMLGINGSNIAYVGPIDSGALSTLFSVSPTSAYSAFFTNGTERMRITSTGSVGIGTTSVRSGYSLDVRNASDSGINIQAGDASADISFSVGSASTADKFVVTAGGNVGIGTSSPDSLVQLKASTQARLKVEETSSAAFVALYQQAAASYLLAGKTGGTATQPLLIYTGGSESMRITSTGNVGIGTTSVSERLTVNGNAILTDGFKIYGNSNAGSTSSYLSLYNAVDGGIDLMANYSTSKITFGTNATERVRIDTSGNLLVGKTAASLGTEGVELKPDGIVRSTRDGYVAEFNRITTDGEIVNLKKAGTTVGSIGGYSGTIHIDGDTGVRYEANAWLPKKTGSMSDAGVSLGSGTYRFKDLYLSGGVVFGSTGGAVTNKTLDDYEQGTWTPVVADASSGGNEASSSAALGEYVKIGKLIHLSCYLIGVNTTGLTGTNDVYVTGLPFTLSGNAQQIGAVSMINTTFSGYLTTQINASAASLRIRENDSGTADHVTVSEMTSGSAGIYFTITYRTS